MNLIQTLESRRMYSSSVKNGVLTLDGTAGNDNYYVSYQLAGKFVTVNENGVIARYAASSVKSIVANLKDSNDYCYIGENIGKINAKIDGGAGSDIIAGGAGNDTIVTGAGNDILNGGSGNDALDGGADNDQVSGGFDNDTLLAGAGADILAGGAGNDLMDGGLGADRINGDLGIDTITYASRSKPVKVDINDAVGEQPDDGETGEKDFVYGTTEIVIGGSGNDVLTGSTPSKYLPTGYTANNTLIGGPGADTLNGLDGNDILKGGDGNDVLNGGVGNDSLSGEGGTDKLFGEAGDDSLFARSTTADKDLLDGGLGTDKAQTDSLDSKTAVEGAIA